MPALFHRGKVFSATGKAMPRRNHLFPGALDSSRFPALREHRPLSEAAASSSDTHTHLDQRRKGDVQADAVSTTAETHTPISSSHSDHPTHTLNGEEVRADAAIQHDTSATHFRHSIPPQRHHRRLARLASANQQRDQPHVAAADPLELRQLDQLAEQYLNWSSRVWDVKEVVEHGPLADTEHPEIAGASTKTLVEHILEDPTYLSRRMTLLASRGDFYSAITLMVTARMHDEKVHALSQISHAEFMKYAIVYKDSKAAVRFLEELPLDLHNGPLFNRALAVCAASRDLDSGRRVMELCEASGCLVTAELLTSLIKVAKNCGDLKHAVSVFEEIKERQLPLDSHVYGALISAFAEAMTRNVSVVHERKEQYVLLERSFQYVAEAQASNIVLEMPAWNSLVTCAGRCGELSRAFGVVEMMRKSGLSPNERTIGALLESCVQAQQQERALRLFDMAIQKGFHSVVIYTQAVSACKIPGFVDWDRALSIYTLMQRDNVRPDRKFYAALMAVAGHAGYLHLAFGLMEEMTAEGLPPTSTTMSALIYACLVQGNIELARKVYDLCRARDVYPVLSQYNRLMDYYATHFRFGDVVSLLSDMISAGLTPNLNTYRVIIIACQEAGQIQLAFEVFSLLQLSKIEILKETFAQTIYHQLVKCCFNQLRLGWGPRGEARSFPPVAYSLGDSLPNPAGFSPLLSRMPALRPREAEAVVRSLGKGIVKGPTSSRSSPLNQPVDSINWASQAISTYQHMLSKGHVPDLSMLDKLFGCLRLKLQHPSDPDLRAYREDCSLQSESSPAQPGVSRGFQPPGYHINSTRGMHQSRTHQTSSRHVAETRHSSRTKSETSSEEIEEKDYESGFDTRAFTIMDQVITRGILPRINLDSALTVNFSSMPPNVAEVYVLSILLALERKAARVGHDYHNTTVTFLVPPFDPDVILWPSYVEKQERPLTQDLSPQQLSNILSGSSDLMASDDTAGSSASNSRGTNFSSLGNLLDDSGSSGDDESQAEQSAHAGQAQLQQDSPRQEHRSSSMDGGGSQQAPEARSEGYTHDPLYGEPYGGYSASPAEEDEDEQMDKKVASMFGTQYLHPHFDVESMSEDDHNEGDGNARSTTGLAVAAVVRKMRLHGSQMNWRDGSILLTPKALTSWLSNRRRRTRLSVRPTAPPASADWARSPSTLMSEASQVGGGIAEQTIRIRSGSYGDQTVRGGSYDEPPVRSGSYDEEDRPRRGTSGSGSYDEDKPRRSASGSGSYDDGDMPRRGLSGSGSYEAGDRMRRSASGSGSYDEGDMSRRAGAYEEAGRVRRVGPYDEGEKSWLPPSAVVAAAVTSHTSTPHTSSPQPEESQTPTHSPPASELASASAPATLSAAASQPHAHNGASILAHNSSSVPLADPLAVAPQLQTSQSGLATDALPDTVGLYKWKTADPRHV